MAESTRKLFALVVGIILCTGCSRAAELLNLAANSASRSAALSESNPTSLQLESGTNSYVIADLFRKGKTDAGVSLGIGVGSASFGSSSTHDLGLAKVHLGWMLSDAPTEHQWYRGNFEFLAEGFAGGQFYPEAAYVVGLTGVLRFNFTSGKRFVPFLDLGAGVSATDIGPPDLSTVFQFNSQGGTGLRWFFNQKQALTVQYRFMHLSNAGIREPNHGANISLFYLGTSWLF